MAYVVTCVLILGHRARGARSAASACNARPDRAAIARVVPETDAIPNKPNMHLMLRA